MGQQLLFKLDQNPNGRGLRCDGEGLFLGRDALLQRDRDGNFEARPVGELRKVLHRAYGDDANWESHARGVKLVAAALNKGDLARATMTAVLMRLPEPGSPISVADVDGMLAKAGFNPDEPRDEQGRWTTEGSESTGPNTPHRDPRIQLADVGMSDASNDPVAEAVARAAEAARRENAQPISADALAPYTDDRGISGHGDLVGHVQLASTAIPMGPLDIFSASPASWANLKRLADGSLELGPGQIVTAATVLSALDRWRERDAVSAAIAKFGLNPAHAADVLAARAYVWAQSRAPVNFADVPWDGPKLEAVCQSIMLLELARPGTVESAQQGDRQSTIYLDLAAQNGLSDTAVLESRRLKGAPEVLQTTSKAARAALGLRPNDGWQAHHLVPVNIIAANLPLATLASNAGWRTDSLDNLIALPADQRTQADYAFETGVFLPIQNLSHYRYDTQTQEEIWQLELRAGGARTPLEACAILETVAIENRAQILSGAWYPRLR
jgi:hypothetical protein